MSSLKIYTVGIDVSSRSSMVSIRQKTLLSQKEMEIGRPFKVSHKNKSLGKLVDQIRELNGEKRVVMECTGRYHESVALFLHSAGFFVSTLNPLLIKEFGNGELHAVKTDKADARKIAEFGMKYWDKLREYEPEETTRYELKTLNRQFHFYLDQKVAQSNNLTSLLEQSYPGAYSLFKSPPRKDGHEKWVDFVEVFWHVDCVRGLSLEAFTEQYRAFCKEKGYKFSKAKAAEIHSHAQGLIALVPMSEDIQFLVQGAAQQVNTVSTAVEKLRAAMNRKASQLPEYETVMNMRGVGDSIGPQLMAEIGDVRRFKSKHSLASFAGIDPGKHDSGDDVKKHHKTSKRGSPHLRRTLFNLMDALIKTKPSEDPVYQFLDLKRSQKKHYRVYMTAGGNKFLRMYYGKVRAALMEKGLWDVDRPEDESESTE